MSVRVTNGEKARAAWGGMPPDWVAVLAAECDKPKCGQRTVGVRIGYSAGTVNAVINNKWPASTAAIERAVRDAYMATTVICPVQGQIGLDKCLDNQALPFASTNNMRVRLYRACRDGCHHSRLDHDRARD